METTLLATLIGMVAYMLFRQVTTAPPESIHAADSPAPDIFAHLRYWGAY